MSPRPRLLAGLAFALAVLAYSYSLGGLHIPHIGDEAPYIEIARLTAESKAWLPLRTAPGLEDTKPPLLFWLGIAATDWARDWSLFNLRAGIVAVTFVTAGVVFLAGRALGGDPFRAFLAALTFLGFYSSFQYGRPFLTNLPETLFTFSSFAVVLFRRNKESVFPWLAAGALLGGACLFKSFALVAPVGLALTAVVVLEGRLRDDFLRLGLVGVIALGTFALWPLLDPDPMSVVEHFIVGENLGKLSSDGYLWGLFHGPYALYLLWLGPFASAGLFVLPLAAVLIDIARRFRDLSLEERALVLYVLSFLVVYSIPSQRQSNYLIPTTPALSILIGLRWLDFSPRLSRWFAVPGLLVAAALLRLVGSMRAVLPEGAYADWQLYFLVALVVAWAAAFAVRSGTGPLFHALVFLTFVGLGVATSPFEGPLGRFEPDRVAFMRRRTVFVPTEFISKHERHRFLLPGARIEGYDPGNPDAVNRLLEQGRLVVVHRPLGTDLDGPYRAVARRLDLRSRQSLSEMWRIFVRGDLDLLVREEVVLRRYRMRRLLRQP